LPPKRDLVHTGRCASLGGMPENDMLIGESFVGESAEAAHVKTVLGRRDGPVGVAWATALATLRAGQAGAPALAEVLAARDRPVNPYFGPAAPAVR